MFNSEGPPNPRPLPPPSKRLHAAIRRLYLEEWTMWTSHYRRYFKIAARLLGIGFLLGFVFFTVQPDQERRALDMVLRALEDIPLDAPGPVLALTLFYHNARASLLAAGAGFIPFLCLPVFDPLLNGAVLGLLTSIARHQGLNVPALVVTGILPHGIFELPAILYVTSVGIYVSLTLGRRMLGSRHRKESRPSVVFDDGPASDKSGAGLGRLGMAAARSFLLVVLPLLLVAALIEVFVTPLLN